MASKASATVTYLTLQAGSQELMTCSAHSICIRKTLPVREGNYRHNIWYIGSQWMGRMIPMTQALLHRCGNTVVGRLYQEEGTTVPLAELNWRTWVSRTQVHCIMNCVLGCSGQPGYSNRYITGKCTCQQQTWLFQLTFLYSMSKSSVQKLG